MIETQRTRTFGVRWLDAALAFLFLRELRRTAAVGETG
jgi:hypothetical protein